MRIFDKIHENELGTVKGHFGPVNYVKYNPKGTAYVSGGEEGFIRVDATSAKAGTRARATTTPHLALATATRAGRR